MTTPVRSEVESTSPPQSSISCFGSLLGRKVKRNPNPGEPTEAFRKEFGSNIDHSTDLIRSRPIRYNQETKKIEVATNTGIGIIWKPIQS